LKKLYIGQFKNEIAAAKAYQEAYFKTYGHYSQTIVEIPKIPVDFTKNPSHNEIKKETQNETITKPVIQNINQIPQLPTSQVAGWNV